MSLPARIRALPCWRGEPAAEPMAGGLSNEIWKVTDAAGVHVARLGADYPFHHVSRAREAMAARAAHAAGFGPAVEYEAQGVMVTAFVPARTWTAADLGANPVRLARLLRGFHAAMPGQVSGPAFLFWPFHVIRDYARTLATSDHAAALPRLLALGAEMEAAQPPLPIVFGHHDLLPANILDDGRRLWLIDFEYAGFGTALFDLAAAAAHGGLDEEAARALLRTYFGRPPGPRLRRGFDAMVVAALLREALWAMVSGVRLAAPGADYAAHAAANLDRLGPALDRYRSRHGQPRP